VNEKRLYDAGVIDLTAWTGVELHERLSGGTRNEVWRGTSIDGQVVVRRSRRTAESLAWELDLMAELDAAGFVVPVPIKTDDGRVSSAGVTVQRWIEGRPPSSIDDWRLVADELLRVHRVTRGRPQRPGCVVTTELTRVRRSVDASMALVPERVATELLEVFAEFGDVETSVIHGDPGPANIRMGFDGRVGLLDWDESRVDIVFHDLSNLGVQVLSDRDHARALDLSDAWEAVNAWVTEPEYARRRLAELRQRRFTESKGDSQ
jgi:Ser/Thr protein kinase RdoA (MazF antagonist)